MLTNIETTIFYFFNKTCHNTILDYVMPFITELGNKKFLFALAVGLLFFKRKHVKISGILLLAGLTMSYSVVYFLKNLIARPRPFLMMENTNILFAVGGFSFPSGHTTAAFLAASILSRCFKRGYIFYIAATSVAVSRIYLGVHFASDVFVGACIGTVIGVILVRIAKSTEFVSD